MRCGPCWQQQDLHLLMLLLPASHTPRCAVDSAGNNNIFICCCCCSLRLLHPDALWTLLATTSSFADAAAPGVSNTQMRCGLLWQRQQLHLLMLLLLASPTPICAVDFSGNDSRFMCCRCCCSWRLLHPDALWTLLATTAASFAGAAAPGVSNTHMTRLLQRVTTSLSTTQLLLQPRLH